MDDRENRRREMFARVQEFGLQRATDFPPTSVGGQLMATLDTIIAQLNSHAISQSSSHGTFRQGTTTRSQAREAVREDLEAINRTARAMSDEVPGLEDKFRLPRPGNDQHLLLAARAFLVDAELIAAQFIAHELSANFLTDLNADIEALQSSMLTQSVGVSQRVAAGVAIDDAIERGTAVVRKLGAIMKNKYGDNRGLLAQWTSVSHTMRSPRRGESAEQPPPPPPPDSGTPTPAG